MAQVLPLYRSLLEKREQSAGEGEQSSGGCLSLLYLQQKVQGAGGEERQDISASSLLRRADSQCKTAFNVSESITRWWPALLECLLYRCVESRAPSSEVSWSPTGLILGFSPAKCARACAGGQQRAVEVLRPLELEAGGCWGTSNWQETKKPFWMSSQTRRLLMSHFVPFRVWCARCPTRHWRC